MTILFILSFMFISHIMKLVAQDVPLFNAFQIMGIIVDISFQTLCSTK